MNTMYQIKPSYFIKKFAGYVILSWATFGFADAIISEESDDLFEMSLEKLVTMEVTSVSKSKQSLHDAPAAAYVITSDDIRRSGVTSIAEALRGVPGLQVARNRNSLWAISSRGFNDIFANKLLVIIDGRSVYTPLFSGVDWDEKNYILDDIDRIEVIRGPGATLWGANAVNGVINIKTKTAAETQGGYLKVGGGVEEQGFASIRYGGKINDETHYRVFAKSLVRDNLVQNIGSEANDRVQGFQSGFRLDWAPVDNRLFTLQGDFYENRQDNRVNNLQIPGTFIDSVNDIDGQNILGRFTHTISDERDYHFQIYYNRVRRNDISLGQLMHIADVEFQHRFKLFENNRIVWGIGYRYINDDLVNSLGVQLMPSRRTTHTYNTFIQDEITLVEDKLKLTLGSKFESNAYTNEEIQPNARIAWTIDDKQTLWGAVSRAVRTPSRAEDDVISIASVTAAATTLFRGSRNVASEDLTAFELGYRIQPSSSLSFDMALFYNEYDNLLTTELGPPLGAGPPFTVFLTADNKMHGETYGIELSTDYRLRDWWHLRGTYSFLKMQLHADIDSMAPNPESAEGRSPQSQFSLRSFMDLPGNFEFDSTIRYVDSLPSINTPDYLELDLRLGYHVNDNLEVSIVGQNLLDSQHIEFDSSSFNSFPVSEVERSVHASITWKF